MTITFYNITSEVNSLSKVLGTGTTYTDFKFKQPTSVLKPTIIMSFATLPTYNYCYITELQKYYFVNPPTILANGLYQMPLLEDVLMTYKTDILGLTCSIERSTSARNQYIPDPMSTTLCTANGTYDAFTPITAVWEKDVWKFFTNSTYYSQNTNNIMVEILCSDFTYYNTTTTTSTTIPPTNGILYVTMSGALVQNMINQIRNTSGISAETFSKIIKNISVFPYQLAVSTNKSVTHVSFPLGVSGGEFIFTQGDVNIVDENCGIRVPQTMTWKCAFTHTDDVEWKNHSPYTELYILFEPFGLLTLNPDIYGRRGTQVTALEKTSGVTLELEIETVTGNCNLYAYPNNINNSASNFPEFREKLTTGNVRVDIDVQYLVDNSEYLMQKAILSVEKSAFGGTNWRQGGIQNLTNWSTGAVMGIGEVATTTGYFNSPVYSIGGNKGSVLIGSPHLFERWQETLDPNPLLYGYYTHRTLATLSTYSGTGYVQVGKVHVSGITNATYDEQKEIEQLLLNGVIV